MTTINQIEGMPAHCKPGNMITLKNTQVDAFSYGNGATISFEQNSNKQISFSAYLPPSVAGMPPLRFLVPSGLSGGCAVIMAYNNGSFLHSESSCRTRVSRAHHTELDLQR